MPPCPVARGEGMARRYRRANGPEQVARARCTPCVLARRRQPSSIDIQVGGVSIVGTVVDHSATFRKPRTSGDERVYTHACTRLHRTRTLVRLVLPKPHPRYVRSRY
uniref:Uncharacterized protein n=1 Tax=Sipha flava TaxID=143950 RepID=A0A2S2QPY7_9HEMI